VFDKLIDLILDSINLFRFWEIVDEYEEAVILRFGKFHRVLGPGIHPVWPFAVERAMSDIVKPTTHNLKPQSLTTSDGVAVVVSGVITRTITDIQTALLECEGVETVITDSAYGVIAASVRNATWEEIATDEFCSSVKSDIHKRAKEYGVAIKRFQWGDLSKARSVRLWNDSTQSKPE
jgi:regulator of protease activity HflC (stomatin/prohibitin superfamily)